MRLSDVLSKPITTDYVQIEGFLGSRKLKMHTALAGGSWCGTERQRGGGSGSVLM